MRFSRRTTNPIFLEDEGHHWKPDRSPLLKVIKLAGLAAGVVLLVLLVVN